MNYDRYVCKRCYSYGVKLYVKYGAARPAMWCWFCAGKANGWMGAIPKTEHCRSFIVHASKSQAAWWGNLPDTIAIRSMFFVGIET